MFVDLRKLNPCNQMAFYAFLHIVKHPNSIASQVSNEQ